MTYMYMYCNKVNGNLSCVQNMAIIKHAVHVQRTGMSEKSHNHCLCYQMYIHNVPSIDYMTLVSRAVQNHFTTSNSTLLSYFSHNFLPSHILHSSTSLHFIPQLVVPSLNFVAQKLAPVILLMMVACTNGRLCHNSHGIPPGIPGGSLHCLFE